MMHRRVWIQSTIGGLLAAPLLAPSQQPGKLPRIGFLSNLNAGLAAPSVEAFRKGLSELGWIEGQNLTIEYRWADGDMSRHAALALELARMPVDLIFTAGTSQCGPPGRQAAASPSSWRSCPTRWPWVSPPAWRGPAAT